MAVIAGAANMLGVSPNQDNSVYSIPLEPAPSTRQGFGRVALGRSIPLSGSSYNIQVAHLSWQKAVKAHLHTSDP